jgi:ubiquinone/menaquinone biosynthesis C-methylase UbiE
MPDFLESDKDAARAVAEIFGNKPAEALKRLDFEDISLGKFVRNYATLPEPADLDTRSSIREDAIVREIARLLGETKNPIRVVDACCGLAGLPRRVITSIGNEVGRIEYLAIERDASCVEVVRTFEDDFRIFGSFKLILRDVCDLEGINAPPADLVILNNVLHEIAPRQFAEMFASLNVLLRPDGGHICVIDMESLPDDAPEAIAIPWSGKEVVDVLAAGGFSPTLTTHKKSVVVYQIHVRRVDKVDAAAMTKKVKFYLQKKLGDAVRLRRKFSALIASGGDDFRRWVVATGQVARLAEELLALS